MNRCQRLLLAAMALPTFAISPMPPASADPCPDAEVVFARGTDEPPGIGRMGEPFVNDLRAAMNGKTVGVYAINYPAISDWNTTGLGVADTVAHVQDMAARCPSTKLVLAGYSQGAAVVSLATESALPPFFNPPPGSSGTLPRNAASSVAAVALFGMPSMDYLNAHGSPAIAVGPQYLDKTINLCVPEDPVCAPGGIDGMSHGSYVVNGMVLQGAGYAAQHMN